MISMILLQFTVIVVGTIATALVLAMERLGTIFEIMTTIGSLLNAPNLTLFTLGMLIPCVGKKGAIAGGCSCLTFLLILVCEKIYGPKKNKLLYSTLPTTTEQCDFEINQTMTTMSTTVPAPSEMDEPFFLFRISVFYYTLMGTLVGVFSALLTSYLTNEMNAVTNPDYFSPVIARFALFFIS